MRAVLIAVVILFAACGSDDESAGPTPIYRVGGTVAGLAGHDLVLRVGGSDQRILGNGAFAFYVPFDDGDGYEVSVRAQPVEPAQICMVSNGTGTVNSADVTGIRVACANDTFAVGGTVAGLAGDGLLLQNNGLDVVAVAEDGPFVFAMPVEDAASFAVTVLAQPTAPNQTCVVSSATGVIAGADVTDVTVACTTP